MHLICGIYKVFTVYNTLILLYQNIFLHPLRPNHFTCKYSVANRVKKLLLSASHAIHAKVA